jgi:PilZ domain-containing protein
VRGGYLKVRGKPARYSMPAIDLDGPQLWTVVTFIVTPLLFLFLMMSLKKPTTTAGAEKRRLQRVPVNSSVVLTWWENGVERRAKARLIDMSDYGAQIRTSKPLSPGAVIFLQAPKLGMTCGAYVRRCSAKGMSFMVGVELKAATMREIAA